MARGDTRDWRWNDVPMRGHPPARPIKIALVPEFPGGKTHPAQAAAVRQAGKHLQAAGYVCEEILPPDLERGVEVWGAIIATESHAGLWPNMQKMGDADGIASMRYWLETMKPVDLAGYMGALTEREGILFRWMGFLQQWPLVIMPTLSDLPPKQAADTTLEGQREIMGLMRPAFIAPLLGLPGLAVPVGRAGRLRTGVQIMAMRNREDLCLDAGEVIEAAEGVVAPVDPAKA
jgi:amidase